VIHQKRIRQAGAVERAVNLHGYNGMAITLGYLDVFLLCPTILLAIIMQVTRRALLTIIMQVISAV
jgi:hypothetical protein